MSYARGSVCHIEIPAPDIPRGKAFYGKVFGWTFQPMGPTYELFQAGDLGGGLDADATPSQDGTLLVLAVEDVDAALEEIAAAGGKKIKGKTEIGGGHGFYGYFADPNGNRLGVWQSAR